MTYSSLRREAPQGFELPAFTPQPWSADAACASLDDPDIMFPHPSDTAGQEAAKAVCASCRVPGACLEYALATGEEEGVWGGTTPKDRAAVHRLKAGRS